MDDKASSLSPKVQARVQAIEEEIFDEDLNWGPYSVGDEQVTDLTAGLEQFGTAAIPLLSRIPQHWSASARIEACAILGRMGPAVTDAIPSLLRIDVVSKRINRLLEFSDPISVRRRHDDHKQFREDLSSYVGNAAKAIAAYTAIQAIVEWLLPVIIFVF